MPHGRIRDGTSAAAQVAAADRSELYRDESLTGKGSDGRDGFARARLAAAAGATASGKSREDSRRAGIPRATRKGPRCKPHLSGRSRLCSTPNPRAIPKKIGSCSVRSKKTRTQAEGGRARPSHRKRAAGEPRPG